MNKFFVVVYSDGRKKVYAEKDVKRGIAAMTSHRYWAPTIVSVKSFTADDGTDVTGDFTK